MAERRTDEETALATEYALFLNQTRGLTAALDYFRHCDLPNCILLRAVQALTTRRTHERRMAPRDA